MSDSEQESDASKTEEDANTEDEFCHSSSESGEDTGETADPGGKSRNGKLFGFPPTMRRCATCQPPVWPRDTSCFCSSLETLHVWFWFKQSPPIIFGNNWTLPTSLHSGYINVKFQLSLNLQFKLKNGVGTFFIRQQWYGTTCPDFRGDLCVFNILKTIGLTEQLLRYETSAASVCISCYHFMAATNQAVKNLTCQQNVPVPPPPDSDCGLPAASRKSLSPTSENSVIRITTSIIHNYFDH